MSNHSTRVDYLQFLETESRMIIVAVAKEAYQNQEIQYDHHVITTNCQHAHLHGNFHMQANYQTCIKN